MLRPFFTRIHEIEKRLSRSFGNDITTPGGRRAAWWHFYLSDHGFLRGLWTNEDEIAPGVLRSNQPSPARLRRLHARGIRTILNLRGADDFSPYLLEREACDALGITLIDLRISARRLYAREVYVELFEIFDRLERPFLMHCKSGADRAGLASALWLMDQEGQGLDAARDMLSLRYLHLKRTKTGLMDHVLDVYEAEAGGRGIRQWFTESFDPEAITASFRAKTGRA